MPWPQSIIKRAVVAALFLSGAAGTLQIYASWLSVQPHGSDYLVKNFGWFFAMYLLILVLYNVLYAVLDAFNLLFRHKKGAGRQLAVKMVFCAIVFVVVMITTGVSVEIRDEAFKHIAARGKPLIAAIKQYQIKRGSPPSALADLVPDYLPSIPGTGVAAYPNYEFITNGAPDRYGGNVWVLTVDVSTSDLIHDAITYYPNANYLSTKQIPLMYRIGDWAYIPVAKSSKSK